MVDDNNHSNDIKKEPKKKSGYFYDDSSQECSSVTTSAEEIISIFGGIRPMASKLGIPVTTVQGWKKRKKIPNSRVIDILNAAISLGIDVYPRLHLALLSNDAKVMHHKELNDHLTNEDNNPITIDWNIDNDKYSNDIPLIQFYDSNHTLKKDINNGHDNDLMINTMSPNDHRSGDDKNSYSLLSSLTVDDSSSKTAIIRQGSRFLLLAIAVNIIFFSAAITELFSSKSILHSDLSAFFNFKERFSEPEQSVTYISELNAAIIASVTKNNEKILKRINSNEKKIIKYSLEIQSLKEHQRFLVGKVKNLQKAMLLNLLSEALENGREFKSILLLMKELDINNKSIDRYMLTLSRWSQTGIPTNEQLYDDFKRITHNLGWSNFLYSLDRASINFVGLLLREVSPAFHNFIGLQNGSSPYAVLDRAHNAIDQNNLSFAIKELDSIFSILPSQLKYWTEKGKDRISANFLIDEINNYLFFNEIIKE